MLYNIKQRGKFFRRKDVEAEIDEKAQLGNQSNILFSGCLITNGKAKAVVIETGMNTETGKIAGLLNKTNRVKTPLQKRMFQFAKLLTVIAAVSDTLLFIIELFRDEEILNILLKPREKKETAEYGSYTKQRKIQSLFSPAHNRSYKQNP